MKRALITGITGQDGHFLSKLLLSKGYEVHGIIRRSSQNALNFPSALPDLDNLHYGDLQDTGALLDIVLQTKPDEVYNLAAQSHVGISFKKPEYTVDVTGLGALRVLNVCTRARDLLGKDIRFYQASSSEIFGKVRETPQTETTPFHPRSPYACAKAFAHYATVNAREAYGMFACSGILFNHESEQRGDDFVTRKITKAVANIHLGRQRSVSLGNLDACRDWGYAKDYVQAMHLMLQQDEPDDYVIATGETHTVREFAERAFREVGTVIRWEGEGDKEIGIAEVSDGRYGFIKCGQVVVKVDPQFYRPSEVNLLIGNASKAKEKLGWTPTTSFEQLVQIMVRSAT